MNLEYPGFVAYGVIFHNENSCLLSTLLELIDRGQVPFMENATSSSSMIHLNYRRVHVSIARPRLNFTTCSTPFHCQITLAPSPNFFLLSSYEHPNTSLYQSINSLSFTVLNLFEVVRFHHPMRM